MINSTRLLAICSFLIFFGYGYQYIFWDAPWRVLVWDQTLLEPLVTGVFGIPWEQYASNLNTNKFIRQLSLFTGILMIISAFSSLVLLKHNKKWLYYPIYLSSFLLLCHAFLEMKDKFYYLGQFLEYSIQVFTPIVYVFYISHRISEKKLFLILKGLVIITFAAHGLYAVGYYPIPGHFIDMTILSIGVTETTAIFLLNVAGLLDLILIPFILYKPTAKIALTYAIIWGLATAFARVLFVFDANFVLPSLHQSIHQVIYRIPHGFIPLVIWWMMKPKQDHRFSNK